LVKSKTNIREGQLYTRCKWDIIMKDEERKSTVVLQRDDVVNLAGDELEECVNQEWSEW
jgi:hypothetical protein